MVESRFREGSSISFADVGRLIEVSFCLSRHLIVSSVEAFIHSSVEAFNSPQEMRRWCHVSLLRRARNHICRTPGLPETALGLFEVMPH